MKVIYLNVSKTHAEMLDISDELEELQRLVGGYIEIVQRRIGGSKKRYCIVCDDEGLLKDDPKVSAVFSLFRPMLVGNLIICGPANGDELTGLSEEDLKHIEQYVLPAGYFSNPVLTCVDF